MKFVDYLIIGAGIVGITIALELKKRFPDAKLRILKKEPELGRHSSWRNRGVSHSGIYYLPGSLKAEVCRQGAIEMKKFHRLGLAHSPLLAMPVTIIYLNNFLR